MALRSRKYGKDARGISLAELCLALLVMASMMLIVFDMVRASGERTRIGRDRATARMILLDLLAILQGRDIGEIKGRITPEGLAELFASRVSLMPDPERQVYANEAADLAKYLRGTLTEAPDPTAPGLVKLSLRAEIPGRDAIEVVTLYRPLARVMLAGSPDGPCVGAAP